MHLSKIFFPQNMSKSCTFWEAGGQQWDKIMFWNYSLSTWTKLKTRTISGLSTGLFGHWGCQWLSAELCNHSYATWGPEGGELKQSPMEVKLPTQTRNKTSGAPIYNIKQAVLDVRLKGDDIHCLAGPLFMAHRTGHSCFNYRITFHLDPECTANTHIYTQTPSMILTSIG